MTVLWNYRTWEFIACTGLIFTSTFEREIIEKINLTKMLNTSTTLRMESIYHFMSNAILDENIFTGVLVEYLPCRNNHPNNRSVKSDNKIHGAKMGTTWVLSAPNGPDVGLMNPDLRDHKPHECGNGLKSSWARRRVCFFYILKSLLSHLNFANDNVFENILLCQHVALVWTCVCPHSHHLSTYIYLRMHSVFIRTHLYSMFNKTTFLQR